MRRDGETVHLTPIEFDLLRALARNRGRLMTHRKLLVEVWGPEYVDDIQPLRTHIARLRAKIEPRRAGAAPRYIVTDPVSATASPAEPGRHEIVMPGSRADRHVGRDGGAVAIVTVMDVVAVALGIAVFALLFLLIEGIDRI